MSLLEWLDIFNETQHDSDDCHCVVSGLVLLKSNVVIVIIFDVAKQKFV